MPYPMDPALLLPLIEDLHRLQDKHLAAPHHARIALDMAASLIETIWEEEMKEILTRRTLISDEDWMELPELYELLDGRIAPKRWGYKEDYIDRHPEEALD